jgi:thymidylate synthase
MYESSNMKIHNTDKGDIYYRFCKWQRKHEEYQYLNLIKELLLQPERKNRTGINTLSLFGKQMRFNLREYFPLLTTKKVFFRGVFEELMWFLKGQTDTKILKNKGVSIWDGNSTKEYLEKTGLSYEEGDVGPVYGFQWRHWGSKYVDCKTDYIDGIDQLKQCIETIKNNPTSRRIIISSWNVSDLSKMALPPCALLCQFYVSYGELSCHVYQRSCDVGLGLPFNIASYALLTNIIAYKCKLKCGDLVWSGGDCHIYANHIEALKIQCERHPNKFPKINILCDSNKEITDLVYNDIELLDYKPQGNIKMEMAV